MFYNIYSQPTQFAFFLEICSDEKKYSDTPDIYNPYFADAGNAEYGI